MSLHFGQKGAESIYFGNHAVASIYRGKKLVWEHIHNVLLQDGDAKFICIEYVPTVNTTVSSASVFVSGGSSYGFNAIIHESGYCVALQSSSTSTAAAEIYGLSGDLVTATFSNSPTLYAGEKYYICYKSSQHVQSGDRFAYYQNRAGNYVQYKVDGNYALESTYVDYETYPYKGRVATTSSMSGTDLADAIINAGITKNALFTWGGGYIDPGTINEAFTYHANTNLANVITITSTDLASKTDIQQYAYILYRAGTNVGRCVRYLPSFKITYEGVNMFGGPDHLYEIQWPMYSNKIVSPNPVNHAAPSNPAEYDMYYKASGVNWGGITDEAVVIWYNNQWEKATGWTSEFTEYTWGTACSTNQTYYHKQFLDAAKTVSTDKKYYLRINGNEV